MDVGSVARPQFHGDEVGNELTVIHLLDQLPPGWRVLRDRRRAPASPATIDHVVVGPTGVHVIDTKIWSGRLWIGDRGVVCGDLPRATEVGALIEVRDLVRRELMLAGCAAPVSAIIALASPGQVDGVVVHNDISFVSPKHLLAKLGDGNLALGPADVAGVSALLERLHPPKLGPVAVASVTHGRSGVRRALSRLLRTSQRSIM
jgi:hypothetical protein